MKYMNSLDGHYVYAVLVSEEDEAEYASWVDSPAELGYETCPARTDDLPPDVHP